MIHKYYDKCFVEIFVAIRQERYIRKTQILHFVQFRTTITTRTNGQKKASS